MRKFKTNEEADKYLYNFKGSKFEVIFKSDENSYFVTVENVEILKSLIGKEVLCTIDSMPDKIIHAVIGRISPNEIYVDLNSVLFKHDNAGWRHINSVQILDVL